MRRILIVDDEVPIAEGLRMLFQLEQIPVVTAADSESAEALLHHEYFPVILADVRLCSEDDGLRLLETIRRISPRSRVASLTGYGTPELEERLRDLGAELVLYKPVEFDELLRVVRDLLGDDDEAETGTTVDVESLYDDLRAVLHSLPMRRFGFAPDVADDIVQQAWCLFLEKRASIREPRGWLAGTVANLCRQELTTRTRAAIEPVEALDDFAAGGGMREEIVAIRQALAQVDARTRALCCLIAIENRSYQEVSAKLNLPVGSIGPLYMRAKTKLRKAMAS
ncbi:MAG TPA: response regulator [Thermoanaerobaculia bacterium]|jgi:RNA polymerase sigma factor (sigma-70 family)